MDYHEDAPWRCAHGLVFGRCATCEPHPAAAVPEAQDGRPGFDAYDEPPHPPYYRMHCPECFDRLATPSAAVREGERERLAAGWDRVLASLLFDSDPESVQQYRAGWEDCAKAVRAHLASLAAPEGTEQ